MRNNKELIKNVIEKGYLKSDRIIKAFYEIDRIDFVSDEYKDKAYYDTALPIGFGQTISQPSTVAFMLELLEPEREMKILDLGSGSGYTTALLAKIAGKKGEVIGIERIKGLVERAKENLAKYDFKNLKIKLSEKRLGLPKQTFDRILVSAAAEEIPNELFDQLKKNAKLVIPIKDSIYLIEKDKREKISTEEYYGFSFVPLVKN
ncbi:MAG: protein-L-isoaspartate(D-aspartate) O-methyltransferase [Candidatus Moranbacteria bacterium]|nr:protein-L-isoaspartate(D-aspartate) O-methyltransferase [Candidatus Moranbacteria bacterium]